MPHLPGGADLPRRLEPKAGWPCYDLDGAVLRQVCERVDLVVLHVGALGDDLAFLGRQLDLDVEVAFLCWVLVARLDLHEVCVLARDPRVVHYSPLGQPLWCMFTNLVQDDSIELPELFDGDSVRLDVLVEAQGDGSRSIIVEFLRQVKGVFEHGKLNVSPAVVLAIGEEDVVDSEGAALLALLREVELVEVDILELDSVSDLCHFCFVPDRGRHPFYEEVGGVSS